MSFDSADAFERWLSEHHEQSDGIWLRFAKKGSGIASVTYAEALDSALCHGWIDGQAKAIDEQWYMQRFTPRRKRSIWSKRNVDKVAKLAEDGRMKPAGTPRTPARARPTCRPTSSASSMRAPVSPSSSTR
jgi:uncharacterized protein YdeI (YjbR/CyaY-like superfamily)